MLMNGLTIRRESDHNNMTTKVHLFLDPAICQQQINQKFNLLRTGIVYGCNSISPVFTKFCVLNACNRSHAPDAFDLDQFLQDEYAYLEYPKHTQSYKDPEGEVIIFHSGSQVLSYNFGTLNLVNKLVSALVVDDFPEALKWHGNLIVLSIVAGKVKNFHKSEDELKRIDSVVHWFVIHHQHRINMVDSLLTAIFVHFLGDTILDWPYIEQATK